MAATLAERLHAAGFAVLQCRDGGGGEILFQARKLAPPHG